VSVRSGRSPWRKGCVRGFAVVHSANGKVNAPLLSTGIRKQNGEEVTKGTATKCGDSQTGREGELRGGTGP